MAEPLPRDEYDQIVIEAANRGAQIAIETHRRIGRSIVVWKDGEIKHIPAHEIEPRDLESIQSVNSRL